MPSPSVLFLDRPFANGMVHIWLREYFYAQGYRLLDGDMPPWKEEKGNLNNSPIPGYLDELNWHEMTRHTLARLRGMYEYELDDEQNAGLVNSFKHYAQSMEQHFKEDNIEYVVIFGNYRIETKFAAIFAEKYGATLICLETFFLQDAFYLEKDSTQIANHHHFTQRWNYYRYFQITDDQRRQLNTLMMERETYGLLDNYIDHGCTPESSQHPNANNIGKKALILGQVSHDAVIVNELTAFENQYEYLCFVIDTLLQKMSDDDQVICRLHPLEARYGDDTALQLRQRYEHEQRLYIYSGQEIDTYALMRWCDFGVVANSQSGMEMAYRQKPVLITAKPYYAATGCFLEAADKGSIQLQLKRLVAGWQPTSAQYGQLENYLCALVFRHLCRRNGEDVFNRLDKLTSDKKSHWLRRLRKIKRATLNGSFGTTNRISSIGVMPDGKPGKSVVRLPQQNWQGKRVLVFGVGSFSYLMARRYKGNLNFCSDNAADCRQQLEGYSIMPFKTDLLSQTDVIIFSCPQEKAMKLLGNYPFIDSKLMYYIEKEIDDGMCEYRLNMLDSKWSGS